MKKKFTKTDQKYSASLVMLKLSHETPKDIIRRLQRKTQKLSREEILLRKIFNEKY